MKHIVAFILALLMVLPLSIMTGASATSVTSPLEDLNKCEGFDETLYPAQEGSGVLQVLHVAETVDDQVLLYVYAPGQVKATHATLSLTDEGKEVDFCEYALTPTATDGVFTKYIVNGLTVDTAKVVRNYEVASILRAFDPALGDKAPADDNTIHEVAYEVGLMWTYVSGDGQYVVNRRSVITVTKKHVGFIRYGTDQPLLGFAKAKDSHYVAFATDKKIDKLLSVNISYSGYDFEYSGRVSYDFDTKKVTLHDDPEITKFENVKKTLTADDVLKEDSLFWGFEYERIQTLDEFQEAEDLTDATKAALAGTQWVLRFAETDYLDLDLTNPLLGAIGGYVTDTNYTRVNNVLLLRMEFETDGVTYNMGVVDDKTSGDTNPDNKDKPDWLLILIIVLVVLILLAPVLNLLVPIFKALAWLIVLPFKILLWLLKAVGKGIAALFRKS